MTIFKTEITSNDDPGQYTESMFNFPCDGTDEIGSHTVGKYSAEKD
jgi:hypothetical protein